MGSQMPNCRACNAPIRFAKTNTGRTMPVDDKPHAEGNLVLYHSGGVLHCRIAQPEPDAMRPKHRSHFVICPKADAYRKDSQPR